jgi:hypothetical protein
MYVTMSISTGFYPYLDLLNANKLHYPHGQRPSSLTATLYTLRSIHSPSHATSAASSGTLIHFSQFYFFAFYLNSNTPEIMLKETKHLLSASP